MLALQEVLWFSFRKKAIKISLLDKLFTLSSNPFNFSPSAFINAPVATCLAGFAWVIPISAILSPGSLVVGPMAHTFIDSNCSVPTFAAASSNISFYQMVPNSDPPAIQGSNPGIQKLANQIFAQGTILDPGSPCGAKSSFQLSFFGPALQCTQTTNPEYMHESADGSNLYYAEDLTRFGEDENSFMGMDFTYYNHTKENYSWIYIDMLCSPYNTTYEISVNYTNGLPDFYTNLTYNTPLLNLSSTQSTYPENFP
ncbi:2d7a29ef-fa59-4742-aaa1-e470fbc88e72-CDS [Sclerotinia trifoliorum]|uniref:2d7a29ef-fa59-4742-aaa1-e470fbc88e72-CDS n=1 Tax=Sclerotinia trifoliorum TaxID=28548 RepID=A0A8H2ZPI2_9HELO|nr:2d7a29ef-fa59-4742-aaa1-e470fbc88e72-CDS [Sclerotinia trifoliorum]